MKRFLSTLLAAALAAALLLPGASAAGGVTFDLSVGGSHNVTVSSGETVTVTFAVTGGEEEKISTLQDEIYYDTDFFELVSCVPAEASCTAVTPQQRANGDHVVQVAYWGEKTLADRTEFAEIQLKVIAKSGSSTVSSRSRNNEDAVGAGVEANYFDDGSPVALTLQNVTVTVGSSASGSGSDSNTDVPVRHKVVIQDTANGTVTADQTAVPQGGAVIITPVPEAGHLVKAVTVTDSAGNRIAVKDLGDGTWSFTMPDGPVSVAVDFYCPSEKYVDFVPTAWYHEAVDYVVVNGYFIGTSETTFEPNAPMTRAMFATVIARMAGFDGTKYTGSAFDDVADGVWYTPAIAWAAENGIVLGYGDGSFGPNDVLTREQMVVMLYRYTDYLRAQVSGEGCVYEDFPDYTAVSFWAEEAMRWAVETGVIQGTDVGLEPQGFATRAQMAQAMMNYTQALRSFV